MNAIFANRKADKHVVREREQAIVASKLESPLALAKRNFCLKGVDIKRAKRSNGVYALF